jgi:pilus assembly protein TadC
MGSVAMGALAVSPLAAAPAVGAVLLARRAAAGRAERRRQRAVAGELPDVIALLGLALGAGMTVTRAVAAVGQRGWGRLAGELRAVADEVANGRRLADCLEELPGRVGEGVRPLTTALLSSERYGTPILESLDRLAAETRADARRRADEAARRAPVKLAFPLVACILPAFALLTVAPLLASALRGLRL